MKPFITHTAVVALGLSAALCLTACVDDDYDLSKDIDMTVQIGSEGFTLPASSTEQITLSQILDLDENSSIKAVAQGQYGLAEGDYVLLQTGNADESEVSIDPVKISRMDGTTTTTQLDEFRGTGSGRTTVDAVGNPTEINLRDDNVTRELVSLQSADVSVDINVEIGFESSDFSGEAIINQGYKAEFDPNWTLEITDPTTASFLAMADKHTAVFTREMPVSTFSKLIGKLHLVHIDFVQGQGLIAPGKFSLSSDVATSGQVSIDGSQLGAGRVAHLDLVVTTQPADAELLAITGVVDPRINVDPTSININDIPDFLSTDENVLDVYNPRISFSVYNTSPVELNLNAIITAYDKDGQTRDVAIGDANGTDPIYILPGTTTHFVVSRRALDSNDGSTNIVVPSLGDLIKTIPDRIEFHNIDVKALPKTVSMKLGEPYFYDCEYEAIVPLAFDADFKLHYTHEETDFDEDLSKYNFNEVEVTAEVINTIPMLLTPTAIALDRDNLVIDDVVAEVTPIIAAGTVEAPSTTQLSIVFHSRAENLGRLDGVRLVFDGSTDAQFVDKNLNKAQSLKFNSIVIKIKGGVTVDLN